MGGYHTYVDANEDPEDNEEDDCKREGQKQKKNGNVLNDESCLLPDMCHIWKKLPMLLAAIVLVIYMPPSQRAKGLKHLTPNPNVDPAVYSGADDGGPLLSVSAASNALRWV